MNDLQRKRQMQAVHAQFKRMAREGTLGPWNDCYSWATESLGRLVSTLTACSDYELNALRDILNGKPPKIHARLRDVLSRSKKNPDSWANWMMHNAPKFSRYREVDTTYTVDTLPLVEAYRMLMLEEPRSDDYRKPDWKPLQQPQRNAQRVADDQRTLWGM